MMFGHDFYIGTLRRYIVMFGNIFNDLQVDRYASDGTTPIQSVLVPIEYGPKQKFIQRVTRNPDLNSEDFSTQVPRLGFEMTAMTYSPLRKLNSLQKIKNGTYSNSIDFAQSFAPVAYDLNFTLHVLVRNAEDGTQIVEQIVPFFTPDFTVTMKVLPDIDLKLDIPIELTNIGIDDQYEGDFETRRILTYSLDFIVKGYLFGPVIRNKYIADMTVRFKDDSNSSSQPRTVSSFSTTGNSEFIANTTYTNNTPRD